MKNLLKEINEIIDEANIVQTRVVKKLNSIESRTIAKNGFIDWAKIELEATDKLYLKSKGSREAINKFSNEMTLRLFEAKNRAKINSV